MRAVENWLLWIASWLPHAALSGPDSGVFQLADPGSPSTARGPDADFDSLSGLLRSSHVDDAILFAA
jgi:hypothetical protein